MDPNENDPTGVDDRSIVDKYYDSIRKRNPNNPDDKDPKDLEAPPSHLGTPVSRYWLIFTATFALTVLQILLVPTQIDSIQGALIPMAFIAGINIFTMTGQAACIGIGAVYLARWIFGKPLKDLFND